MIAAGRSRGSGRRRGQRDSKGPASSSSSSSSSSRARGQPKQAASPRTLDSSGNPKKRTKSLADEASSEAGSVRNSTSATGLARDRRQGSLSTPHDNHAAYSNGTVMARKVPKRLSKGTMKKKGVAIAGARPGRRRASSPSNQDAQDQASHVVVVDSLENIPRESREQRKNAANRLCPSDGRIFITAGIYSSAFKVAEAPPISTKPSSVKLVDENPVALSELLSKPIMPLPIYYGHAVATKKTPFQLPLAFYAAYKEGTLRADKVPPPVFKKLRNSVPFNADVKALLAKAKQEESICDCFAPADGSPGCQEDCLNRIMFFECGPNCPTGSACSNKRMQKRLRCRTLRRVHTAEKGWGIVATSNIPKNTFILEYTGEIMTAEMYGLRAHTEYKDRVHFHCIQLHSNLVIDGGTAGGEARFINHSCDPNCHTEKWNVGGFWRVGIFSSRDILEGEELAYDYKFESFSTNMTCHCGAASCRGEIRPHTATDELLAATLTRPDGAGSHTYGRKRDDLQKKQLRQIVKHGKLYENFVWTRPNYYDVSSGYGNISARVLEKVVRPGHVFLLRNIKIHADLAALRREGAQLANARREEEQAYRALFHKHISKCIKTNAREVPPNALEHVPRKWHLGQNIRLGLLLYAFLQALTAVVGDDDNDGDGDARRLATFFVKLPSKRKHPRYYQMADRLIDLTTVRKSLLHGEYKARSKFYADIVRTLQNARNYFPEESEEYGAAHLLLTRHINPLWESIVEPEISAIFPDARTPHQKKILSRLCVATDLLVRCSCGTADDVGQLIQCSICKTWQHTRCLAGSVDMAAEHTCFACGGAPGLRNILLQEPAVNDANAKPDKGQCDRAEIAAIEAKLAEYAQKATVAKEAIKETAEKIKAIKATLTQCRTRVKAAAQSVDSLKKQLAAATKKLGMKQKKLIALTSCDLGKVVAPQRVNDGNKNNVQHRHQQHQQHHQRQQDDDGSARESSKVASQLSEGEHNRGQSSSKDDNHPPSQGTTAATATLTSATSEKNEQRCDGAVMVTGDTSATETTSLNGSSTPKDPVQKMKREVASLRDSVERALPASLSEQERFVDTALCQIESMHKMQERLEQKKKALQVELREIKAETRALEAEKNKMNVSYISIVSEECPHRLSVGQHVYVDFGNEHHEHDVGGPAPAAETCNNKQALSIAMIEQITQSSLDGTFSCTGRLFLPPTKTFCEAKQKFCINEVTLSSTIVLFTPSQVKGTCLVMPKNLYTHMRPVSFAAGDVYVCEYLYNERNRSWRVLKSQKICPLPPSTVHFSILPMSEPLHRHFQPMDGVMKDVDEAAPSTLQERDVFVPLPFPHEAMLEGLDSQNHDEAHVCLPTSAPRHRESRDVEHRRASLLKVVDLLSHKAQLSFAQGMGRHFHAVLDVEDASYLLATTTRRVRNSRA